MNPSPILEREYSQRTPSRAPWRKFLAYSMVLVMTVSALTIVFPSGQRIVGAPQSPDQQIPAETELNPGEYVNYTVSNMFEINNKSTNYNDRGAHLAPGIPSWWWFRNSYGYPDTIIRNSYPYTLLYDYYSANIPAAVKDPRMGFGTYSFFRVYMDAENFASVATGANKDPIFIPILDPADLGSDGGFVNWTWRIDYLTSQECTDIVAGNHYANTYYGVPAGAIGFGGGDANDGWWNELHGKVDFNVNAAKKFLNLPGTGDLRTEFATANAGGAVDTAWAAHWTVDGKSTGTLNIYCTYDYQIDSGTIDSWLTVDPSSTATKLVLRIWGHAWGYEILMNRMLERVGVGKFFQNYPEDVYLNGSAGPNNGDVDVRQTAVYKMLAWKDMTYSNAAWNLDTWHTDAWVNSLANPPASWPSRYGQPSFGALYSYAPTSTNNPQRYEWSPGTVNYGTRVMYWQPPMGFNLTAHEKVVVKLPNAKPGLGVGLYAGGSDTINQAKATEIRSNSFWGEVVLGHGYPSMLYSSTYYNHATKTITLDGGNTGLILNSDPNENTKAGCGARNETGSPDFVFSVSKVSTFDVVMSPVQATYTSGTAYNVVVTARNYTGVATANGTVTLSCNNAGTTFPGGNTHNFETGGNPWTTSVVFGEGKSNTYINATSDWFPLDVNGTTTKLTVLLIPEFSMLVLPIVGAAAMVVVIERFTKKKK